MLTSYFEQKRKYPTTESTMQEKVSSSFSAHPLPRQGKISRLHLTRFNILVLLLLLCRFKTTSRLHCYLDVELYKSRLKWMLFFCWPIRESQLRHCSYFEQKRNYHALWKTPFDLELVLTSGFYSINSSKKFSSRKKNDLSSLLAIISYIVMTVSWALSEYK